MPIPSPRTAPEASRLCRCTEAAARLDVAVYNVPGVFAFEVESFKVDAKGQRTSRRYVVDVATSSCNCPDFRQHGQFCKHLLYIESLVRIAEVKATAAIALFEQARQEEDREFGQLYMQNLHTERSLLPAP